MNYSNGEQTISFLRVFLDARGRTSKKKKKNWTHFPHFFPVPFMAKSFVNADGENNNGISYNFFDVDGVHSFDVDYKCE